MACVQSDFPGARGPRPPRIVVIEDDAALLSALKFSLEAEGYDIRPFLGEAQILEHPTSIADASCIVLDYRLTPLDGLELLTLLKARGLKARAILMTTHPDQRCRDEAHRLGARIVEKPLLNDALSHAIRDLLGEKSTR
jgi:two-component system response regulator FixJ